MANKLLLLMPDNVRDELAIAGGDFVLKQGEAVARETLEGGYVYIVEHGAVSKFLRSRSGIYSEIGMVGIEGMFPTCGLLNVAAAPHIVLSQIGEVRGRRIRSREFHSIVQESPEAQLLVRKYVYAFLTQISSNLLALEQDDVEKRVARWLLMCLDRVEGEEINITHDLFAQMVASHRPTVTRLLNKLKSDRVIELGRGRIIVRDRAALLELADDSYGLFEHYWQTQIADSGPSQSNGNAHIQGNGVARGQSNGIAPSH